jgi:hypothetical protein
MRQIVPIGPHTALFPEVGLGGNGQLALLYSVTDGRLMMAHFDQALDPVSMGQLEPTRALHAWARLSWPRCVYKLDVGDSGVAVLRNLGTGECHELDECNGNQPVAISDQYYAWQWRARPDLEGVAGYKTILGRLDLSIAPLELDRGAPDGLSRILPHGAVRCLYEDRLLVPGMLEPCWAGPLVAGSRSNPSKGVLVKREADAYQLVLWPDAECRGVRMCQVAEHEYAVTCWGPEEGVMLAIFNEAELEPPPPPPVVPKPTARILSVEPVQGIVPFTTTAHAEILNAETHRWRFDGEIHHPHNDNPHAFEIRESGTHDISLQASGPGGVTPMEHYTVTGLPPPDPQFPAGFYGLVDGYAPSLYPELPAFGWEMIRVPATTESPDFTRRAAKDVLDAGFRAFTVCYALSDLEAAPEYTDVDWGNEPNSTVDRYYTPAQYLATLPEVIAICERRHLRLWVGSINNLSREGLDYLAAIMPGVPLDVGLSPHRYPHGFGMKFETPHPGFASRAAEVAALKTIIGSRRWGIGEVGYHQARETAGFLCRKKSCRLGDTDVQDRMRREFAFWRDQGADFCCWYQLLDGERDIVAERYGIRRGSTWKPQACIAQ